MTGSFTAVLRSERQALHWQRRMLQPGRQAHSWQQKRCTVAATYNVLVPAAGRRDGADGAGRGSEGERWAGRSGREGEGAAEAATLSAALRSSAGRGPAPGSGGQRVSKCRPPGDQPVDPILVPPGKVGGQAVVRQLLQGLGIQRFLARQDVGGPAAAWSGSAGVWCADRGLGSVRLPGHPSVCQLAPRQQALQPT